MSTRRKISQTKRQIIFARDGWSCCYCGLQGKLLVRKLSRPGRLVIIPTTEKGDWFEIDHIVPVSLEGDCSFNNLITSCPPCNKKKAGGTTMKPVWRMFIVDIK